MKSSVMTVFTRHAVARTVRRCTQPSRHATSGSNHIFDTLSATSLQHRGTVAHHFKAHVSDAFSIGDAPNGAPLSRPYHSLIWALSHPDLGPLTAFLCLIAHLVRVSSPMYSLPSTRTGGYLMAMAVQAAQQCVEHQDPLSVSCHYMNKTLEKHDADVEVRVLSAGRSSSTVEMTISQEDKVMSKFLATFGTLDRFKGFTAINDSAPALPPVGDCLNASVILRKANGGHLKIAQQIEVLVAKDGEFAKTVLSGKQTGPKAELIAWIKFAQERPFCLRSLTFFLDALPPPVLNMVASDWVPTLEYTAHCWATPNPGEKWMRARFVSDHVENGVLYTDGDIWSEDGTKLYAKSRQLARVLTKK